MKNVSVLFVFFETEKEGRVKRLLDYRTFKNRYIFYIC